MAHGFVRRDHAHIDHETPTGSLPTTAFTLANTPHGSSEHVYVNGLHLRRVAAGAGVNEYTISGAVITTGWTVAAGSIIWAHYRV